MVPEGSVILLMSRRFMEPTFLLSHRCQTDKKAQNNDTPVSISKIFRNSIDLWLNIVYNLVTGEHTTKGGTCYDDYSHARSEGHG